MTTLANLRHPAQIVFALICLVAAFDAGAVYNCSISITAISTVYSPTVITHNDSTGTYTMNCTRGAGDAALMTYTLRASDGLSPGPGTWNQVQFGANRYNYELYRNAGFSQVWGNGGGTDIDNTNAPVDFGTSLAATFSGPFYLRVFGNQTVVPAGTYTDTVTITLNPGGAFNTATTSLSVSVVTTNSCQITVSPSNVNFAYTSFQAAPAGASSTYGVRCTTGFPYNMALDGTLPYTYNLLGLTYTLSIPASATGTGLTQTHTIDGNIAAGQAGTCATAVCNGSQTRTLTISW